MRMALMADKEYTFISIDELVHETDKAILVKVEGDKEWIPKSQMPGDFNQDYNQDELEVEIWFAEDKGWY